MGEVASVGIPGIFGLTGIKLAFQDEGVLLGDAQVINFTGDGVVATLSEGILTIQIDGGGGGDLVTSLEAVTADDIAHGTAAAVIYQLGTQFGMALQAMGVTIDQKADIESSIMTGSPQVPTQPTEVNSDIAASTAFVHNSIDPVYAELTNKAPLVDGLVPAIYLPSFVDDVLEFADLASFPAEGEASKIYIAVDTGLDYRWTGSVYVVIGQTSDVIGIGANAFVRYDQGQLLTNGQKEQLADNAGLAGTAGEIARSAGAPVFSLIATGVAAGTYGSGSQIPVIQFDAKGRAINVTLTGVAAPIAVELLASASSQNLAANAVHNLPRSYAGAMLLVLPNAAPVGTTVIVRDTVTISTDTGSGIQAITSLTITSDVIQAPIGGMSINWKVGGGGNDTLPLVAGGELIFTRTTSNWFVSVRQGKQLATKTRIANTAVAYGFTEIINAAVTANHVRQLVLPDANVDLGLLPAVAVGNTLTGVRGRIVGGAGNVIAYDNGVIINGSANVLAGNNQTILTGNAITNVVTDGAISDNAEAASYKSLRSVVKLWGAAAPSAILTTDGSFIIQDNTVPRALMPIQTIGGNAQSQIAQHRVRFMGCHISGKVYSGQRLVTVISISGATPTLDIQTVGVDVVVGAVAFSFGASVNAGQLRLTVHDVNNPPGNWFFSAEVDSFYNGV